MTVNRSVRITVDAAVTDEAWQKLLRKMLVATAEAGTTLTTTAVTYAAGTGADNVEVAVAKT